VKPGGRQRVSEIITIPVFEIVGSALCVASDDGEKVYERIEKAIRQGRSIALSFANVTSLTSAFLNAAIGQLYGEFPEEEIRAKLSVREMEPDDLALLKRVVDTAKVYFRDPSRFAEVRRLALEEDNDL
jgi:hypothetical protein